MVNFLMLVSSLVIVLARRPPIQLTNREEDSPWWVGYIPMLLISVGKSYVSEGIRRIKFYVKATKRLSF